MEGFIQLKMALLKIALFAMMLGMAMSCLSCTNPDPRPIITNPAPHPFIGPQPRLPGCLLPQPVPIGIPYQPYPSYGCP